MEKGEKKSYRVRKALCRGIESNDETLIREIIKNNKISSIDFMIEFGASPIEFSIENGSLDAAKALIKGGIGLDAGISKHPLELAIMENKIELIPLFLKAGVDVNRDLGKGWTFLMRAAWCGNREAINLLIDHGADIGRTTEEGWTANSLARQKGFFDLSGLLMSRHLLLGPFVELEE